jgi:hypothetical protein
MSSNIQNILSDYAPDAPAGVWEKIAAALENGESSFPGKLFQYEEMPSAALWDKITPALDVIEREPVKIIPFHKRYSRPLKYAAATAAFVIFAVLSSLLISKKTRSEEPVRTAIQTNTSAPKEEQSIASGQDRVKQTPAEAITDGKATDREKAAVAIIKTHQAASSMALLARVFPKIARPNSGLSFSSMVDKYMVYSDGEGNATRLPKKLFDLFVCPTDDILCVQRKKNLQEKIASSALTSDFTGVLEIINNLRENK